MTKVHVFLFELVNPYTVGC